MRNKDEKFEFIYSPRTTISNIREKEERIFNDLKIGFDPYTIKIMKKHYKEHLGKLNKETFISILKRHLLMWHPNLPNREKTLIKLLSRLFDEIDLNSNGDLEWDEFVNYITNSSYHHNYENSVYSLQQYSLSKNTIDHQDISKSDLNQQKFNFMSDKNTDIISYCFYINKYKTIGIVHEGKSRIVFFDGETFEKESFVIDLNIMQKEIDKLELNELNLKVDEILLKEEIEKKKNNHRYKYQNNSFLKYKGKVDLNKELNKAKNLANKNNNNKKNNDEEDEDEDKVNIKEENKITKKEKIPTKKGLFASCTFFVPDYDLLFISSTNNKISAWIFNSKSNSFKNANKFYFKSNSDFIFENSWVEIPIFSTKLPQNTLCFDIIMKCLYSGQEDGKILKWDMNSPTPSYIFDINDEENKKILSSLSNYNIMNTDEKNQTKKLSPVNRTRNFLLKKAKNTEFGKEKDEISRVSKNTKNLSNFKQNSFYVSCLLMIERLRLLCSSYFTGQIIFWDIITKKPKKLFNDQKTVIYNMVFDPTKNLLFTCGFGHEIFVYEPYNNNAIYKLKGHNGSVCSLSLNQDLNELITIDICGIIKIWDTNNLTNFQTINTIDSLLIEQNHAKKSNDNFSIKKKIKSNVYLLSLQNIKKILIYGEKLMIYEKGKDKNPNLTDDNPLLGCVYNNLSKDIISFSNKRVKIWNIFTGKVKKMYDDLMKGYEITSFTYDKQMKRFYLGDNGGHIKGFNMFTGDLLKDFLPHEKEIINVIHSTKFNLLISCSSDLCIKFQNDEELKSTELIKEIYARPLNPTLYMNNYTLKLRITILDEENGVLIIGLSNGMIMHYDVSHYKFFLDTSDNNKEISLNKQIPISCITDIPQADVLFVAYDNGEKCLTAKTKNKYYHYLAGEKFGNFDDGTISIYDNEDYIKNSRRLSKNNSDQNLNELKKYIIISSSYDNIEQKLFTGDHTGGLWCYDLKPLIDFMQLNNENKTEEEIKNNLYNDIKIKLIFKIQAHSEAIKYLCIPQELVPKIIITTSNDRTVRLLDFYTGSYIETLKQISIKYCSIPIGIKYVKDNPFLPSNYETLENKFDDENPDKNIITILKEDIKGSVDVPKINFEEANHSEIVEYFDKIMEYNAKIQLLNTTKGQKISANKSNQWDYNVDTKILLQKNEDEIKKLIDIVSKKEYETNQTEKKHQQFSIFNYNYTPLFIDNLDRDEKYELKNQINSKIRNINLAVSKSIVMKKEMEAIENLRNKNQNPKNKNKLSPIKTSLKKLNKNFSSNTLNTNKFFNDKTIKILNEDTNKNNKTNMSKMLKLSSIGKINTFSCLTGKMSNSTSSLSFPEFNNNIPLADQRFADCKNQFDEKFNELTGPIRFLIYSQKKNSFLPKINKKI